MENSGIKFLSEEEENKLMEESGMSLDPNAPIGSMSEKWIEEQSKCPDLYSSVV